MGQEIESIKISKVEDVMHRYQRILSETGTYHVMMRGNVGKNLFQGNEDK
ncbi:MAG: hypothetical protein PHC92_11735 [Syntrophomonadaceae bacterium]|nr:hypothetical protein [Syntrophomonadaceae bacterium]